jgi:hypothetical protein
LSPGNFREIVNGLCARTRREPCFIYGEHGRAGARRAPNRGFYAVAGEPKEILEVPGAQHVGGITTRPAEYERRVLGFFDRTLGLER